MKLLQLFIVALCYCGFHAAMAMPIAPWNPFSTSSAGSSSESIQLSPVLGMHAIAWNGRALTTFEAGAGAEFKEQYALGLTVLSTTGHGRTFVDEYDGDGWHVWGSAQSRREIDARVTYGLSFDYIEDDVYIHAADATTDVQSWTDYSATGVVLDAKTKRGKAIFLGRTGIYQAKIFDKKFATVGMLGAGVEMPLGKRSLAQLRLSGFQDDSDGRHYNYALDATVTYRQNARTSFTIGGSFYPKGVPLAGTPFSSAALIGASFGDGFVTDIRSEAFGNISLTGQFTF